MTPDIGQLVISRKPGESFFVGDYEVVVNRVPGTRQVEVQAQAPRMAPITKRLHADAKLHLTEDISIQTVAESRRIIVTIRAPKHIKILRSELVNR